MEIQDFLKEAIQLLQEVQENPRKEDWCRKYSVYSSDRGQEELERRLNNFMCSAYDTDIVISNYREVIEQLCLPEDSIAQADEAWVSQLSYIGVLACIAWHFRRDHFCEGSLISDSIANGAMLRLFQRLQALRSVNGVKKAAEGL